MCVKKLFCHYSYIACLIYQFMYHFIVSLFILKSTVLILFSVWNAFVLVLFYKLFCGKTHIKRIFFYSLSLCLSHSFCLPFTVDHSFAFRVPLLPWSMVPLNGCTSLVPSVALQVDSFGRMIFWFLLVYFETKFWFVPRLNPIQS